MMDAEIQISNNFPMSQNTVHLLTFFLPFTNIKTILSSQNTQIEIEIKNKNSVRLMLRAVFRLLALPGFLPLIPVRFLININYYSIKGLE